MLDVFTLVILVITLEHLYKFLIMHQIACWFPDRRQCRWHCWGELQRLLPNPSVLVAVSNGLRALKLCTNKIVLSCRCRLTQVDLYNCHKTVVVVCCLEEPLHRYTVIQPTLTQASVTFSATSYLLHNDCKFQPWTLLKFFLVARLRKAALRNLHLLINITESWLLR